MLYRSFPPLIKVGKHLFRRVLRNPALKRANLKDSYHRNIKYVINKLCLFWMKWWLALFVFLVICLVLALIFIRLKELTRAVYWLSSFPLNHAISWNRLIGGRSCWRNVQRMSQPFILQIIYPPARLNGPSRKAKFSGFMEDWVMRRLRVHSGEGLMV